MAYASMCSLCAAVSVLSLFLCVCVFQYLVLFNMKSFSIAHSYYGIYRNIIREYISKRAM